MEASEFFGIDPALLEVGDGTDARPVWVGVDGQTGRVYRLFASGRFEGLGDGVLMVFNGRARNNGVDFRKATQETRGVHCLIEDQDQDQDQDRLLLCELPKMVLETSFPLRDIVLSTSSSAAVGRLIE